MVNTLMFCVNILVICADCAGHRYSEFYGIEELNSSKHKLAKSKNFQPNGHVQPYELNSKYPNTIKNRIPKRDTPWSHVLRDIKIQRATFDQAVFATGLSKLLQLLLVSIGAELAAWPWNTLVKFEHSTIQQLKTDILAASRTTKSVFLWDKVDQMLFTGPPHSSPKLSPQWNQIESKHAKRTWEVTHDLDFATESWMQLLVYFAPFFQPSCNVRRRFLIEKDS